MHREEESALVMHILCFCYFSSVCLSQRGSVKWQVDKGNTCSLHLSFAPLSLLFASFFCLLFSRCAPSLLSRVSPILSLPFTPTSFFALMQPVKHLTEEKMRKEMQMDLKCLCASACLCVRACVVVSVRDQKRSSRKDRGRGGCYFPSCINSFHQPCLINSVPPPAFISLYFTSRPWLLATFFSPLSLFFSFYTSVLLFFPRPLSLSFSFHAMFTLM